MNDFIASNQDLDEENKLLEAIQEGLDDVANGRVSSHES